MRLLPGDIVPVASNGLLGACGADGDCFGSERLAELLTSLRTRPTEQVVEDVLSAAAEHSGRPTPTDDLMVPALRSRPEE